MDRKFLEFIAKCSSQYDSTCRELAAELLKVQDERDEAKRVLEIMERDLRGRLELVTSRLSAAEDRLDRVVDAWHAYYIKGKDSAVFYDAISGYTRTTERT